MFYLNALLPLLALSASSGLANPLPQSQSSSTAESSASSAPSGSSTTSGFPTSIATESLTQSTDTSSQSSAASSASGSATSIAAVQTSAGSIFSSTTGSSSAAAPSQSPSDIYSHDPLIGVQLKSSTWDDKCLSPDPREEVLREGIPVDLYPCVNTNDTSKNAKAWNVVPGEGALVITGTQFALDAGGVNVGVNSSLVLKKSENCSPLQSWYATNDMRIAVTGSGFCLTEDRDTDGSGPDKDLGIILYNCTDENTDQMFLTINATNQDHVPIRPVRSDYTPGVDLPSTSPNIIAAVQTGSNSTESASTASTTSATASSSSGSSIAAVDTNLDTVIGTTSRYTSVFISVPSGSASGSATSSATSSVIET